MPHTENTFAPMPDVDNVVADAPAPRKRGRPRLDRSTLGVGVLLVLAGAGLYYMHWRTREGVEMLANADADAAGIASLLAEGQESLVTLTRDMRATHEAVDRFTRRDGARLAGAKPMAIDPFLFVTTETKKPVKSIDVVQQTREQARTQAFASAQRMQLQSILFGSTRRSCLIDGKLYFEGQTCGEFTISRIAADAVGVRSGEFKFELRLRK